MPAPISHFSTIADELRRRMSMNVTSPNAKVLDSAQGHTTPAPFLGEIEGVSMPGGQPIRNKQGEEIGVMNPNLGLPEMRPAGRTVADTRLQSPVAEDAIGNLALSLRQNRGGTERSVGTSQPIDGPAPGRSRFRTQLQDKLKRFDPRKREDDEGGY